MAVIPARSIIVKQSHDTKFSDSVPLPHQYPKPEAVPLYASTQIILLWGTAITYAVTGGKSLQAVYHNNGGTEISRSLWIVIFGAATVFISQVCKDD